MAANTWIAAGAGLASTDANWSLGHKPVTGETPTFITATSANNCSWDYAISDLASIDLSGASAGGVVAQAANVGAVGAFGNAQWTWQTSIKTLTVGNITLGAAGQLQQTGTNGNVTCTSYTQSGVGSVLTGKTDATFTCNDFTETAGTISNYVLTLIMAGAGGIFAVLENSVYLNMFTAAAPNVTVSSKVYARNIAVNLNCNIINNGASLNGPGLVWHGGYSAGYTYTNLGYISGTGYLSYYTNAVNRTDIKWGDIRCELRLTNVHASSSFFVLLAHPETFGKVTVGTVGGTGTMTLDLNGLVPSASGLITASTRSIITSSVPGAIVNALGGITVAATATINRTNLTVINSGNYDSSAGTDTAGQSLYVHNGPGTIKLPAASSFYNFIATANAANAKLLSDLTIGNVYAHVNPLDLGGKVLTLTKPENEYTGLRRPMVRNLTKLDIGAVGLADGWLEDMGALL